MRMSAGSPRMATAFKAAYPWTRPASYWEGSGQTISAQESCEDACLGEGVDGSGIGVPHEIGSCPPRQLPRLNPLPNGPFDHICDAVPPERFLRKWQDQFTNAIPEGIDDVLCETQGLDLLPHGSGTQRG